ncbi:hypothetical protein Tco_1132279 [Tanacetum coccineum]|uniref:Uncharacterized protein n=1 Tax=Tanacetum coccineum TaxID=301880 RepID=A0ABQ5JEE1_9ASTR
MKSFSNDLQIKDYHNEKIDIRFRRECEDMTDELKSKLNRVSIEINKKKELQYLEQVAKLSTYTTEPSRHFNCTCYDDDDYEESSIPLRDIISKLPPESRSHRGSDSDCDLPSCDDFSPINIYEEKSVLENIESKESYVSNLDEPVFLVTPLSDTNKDECFDPGGENNKIDAFLDMDISTDIKNGYHDSEGDIIYLESLLINDNIPNLPPEVFLDHDPRSLKDEPDKDDLKSIVKIFDPGIYEKKFSPTYVNFTLEIAIIFLQYVIEFYFLVHPM